MIPCLKDGNRKLCFGCGACVLACPHHCIAMGKDEEGFYYAAADEAHCTGCGICCKACPVAEKAGYSVNAFPQVAYAARNADVEELLASTSGGVFSSLAEDVLGCSGVVFGCAFNGDFQARHIRVDTKEDLCKLRGSKYVQSSLGDNYQIVKEELGKGKRVLFSGTPCQVAGLKSYLKKLDNNLLMVDIICHGVPSQDALNRYLQSLSDKHGGKVIGFSFRSKQRYGWQHSLTFSYKRNTMVKTIHLLPYQSAYYSFYLAGYLSRPACYTCPYTSKQREGDITLGDFWGIESIAPRFFAKNGASLIIVNTQKGAEALDRAKRGLALMKTDLAAAASHNDQLCRPMDMPNDREEVYRTILGFGFDAAYWRYGGGKMVAAGFLKSIIPGKFKTILKRVMGII